MNCFIAMMTMQKMARSIRSSVYASMIEYIKA